MKRIAIVSPSLKMGGIERSLSVLANYFAKQNYTVVFISCLKGKHFYDLSSDIIIEEPDFKRTSGLFNKVITYIRIVRFIKHRVIINNPDAVLSFGDFFNPLTLLALKNTSYPVYISDRTSPDYDFSFPIPQLKAWLYPKAAGFIAQTSRAAAFKENQFGKDFNISVIPNAMRKLQEYDIEKEPVILYVGRFAWEKAPQYLIKAFAQIENKGDWKLVMAGSGPMLSDMKALAQKLEIDSRVEFLGRVKNVDILYAKASIFVLPSVVEGFPNALIEAMAAGLPCICFDTIAHEDIFLEEGMGIVCEKTDSKMLAGTIEKLMNNKIERERIGKNAQNIKSYLEIEQVNKKILKFMDLL